MPPSNEDPLEITDSGAFARLAFSGSFTVADVIGDRREAGEPAKEHTTRKRRRRQDWIAGLTKPVALILLLLGPLLAFGAYRAAASSETEDTRARLQEAVTARAAEIEREFNGLREVDHSFQGLFDASDEVERHEFATFARQARARHPCIQKLVWVPYVPASELEAHEKRVCENDYPRYRVRRDHGQPRPEGYYPILYVEPQESHEHLIGMDAMADPRRAWAIEWAASSRAAVLSDPIKGTVVRGTTERGRAMADIALAVYPKPDTLTRERGRARGVVLLTFDYEELARQSRSDASAAESSLLRLQLIDPITDDGPALVAETGAAVRGLETDLVAEHQLSIAGQAWLLRAWPTAMFRLGHRSVSPLLIALLVFLVWELFAGFLLALGHASRGHALRSQGQMVGRVLQSLGEGVIVATCDGRVRLANHEARKLLGADTSQLHASEIPALLRFEGPDGQPHPRVGMQPLERALRGETLDAVECIVRTPTAPEGVWVSVSGRPIHNNLGELRGGLLIIRDISAKRSSEEMLREQKVEMELAARVQQSLYPSSAPHVDGLDIAGVVYPAHETCGDYYDYIPLPDGSICLAIGDVSGHGLGPALVMAETRAYVRSLMASGVGLEAVLSRANAMLAHDLQDEGLFVTMLLIRIDPRTREIRYASAGHTPGLLIDAQGGLKAQLSHTGRPLGMFEDSTYESRNGNVLAQDDMLVLMTDGATEASSPDKEMFEEDGVLEVVRENLTASADELVARVYDAIVDFSVGTSKRDDVTLLVCKVEGEPAEARPPMREIARRALSITAH